MANKRHFRKIPYQYTSKQIKKLSPGDLNTKLSLNSLIYIQKNYTEAERLHILLCLIINTFHPFEYLESNLDKLHKYGFSEQEIIELALILCCYKLINEGQKEFNYRKRATDLKNQIKEDANVLNINPNQNKIDEAEYYKLISLARPVDEAVYLLYHILPKTISKQKRAVIVSELLNECKIYSKSAFISYPLAQKQSQKLLEEFENHNKNGYDNLKIRTSEEIIANNLKNHLTRMERLLQNINKNTK